MRFCPTCDELVGIRHNRGHILIGYKEMSDAHRRSAANQLGTRLARLVQLNPGMIVLAFLSALDDAGQHDFSRMVEKRWAQLIKH